MNALLYMRTVVYRLAKLGMATKIKYGTATVDKFGSNRGITFRDTIVLTTDLVYTKPNWTAICVLFMVPVIPLQLVAYWTTSLV